MVKVDLEKIGYLHKLHNKQWKKGWFILRHNILYKYRSHYEKYPYGQYVWNNVKVKELQADPGAKEKMHFCFMVTTDKGKQTIFAASSEEELRDWIQSISGMGDDQVDEIYESNQSNLTEQSEPVLAVPLEDIHLRNKQGIPIFINCLMDYVEATAAGVPDLFTKPPNPILISQIQEGELDFELIKDPHAVAGLIQVFLKKLPTPLITYELRACFIAVSDIENVSNKIKVLKTLSEILPELHYNLLRRLLQFLYELSKLGNLQTLDHLASTFSVLLLRKSKNAKQNTDFKSEKLLITDVTKILILYWDRVLPDYLTIASSQSEDKNPDLMLQDDPGDDSFDSLELSDTEENEKALILADSAAKPSNEAPEPVPELPSKESSKKIKRKTKKKKEEENEEAQEGETAGDPPKEDDKFQAKRNKLKLSQIVSVSQKLNNVAVENQDKLVASNEKVDLDTATEHEEEVKSLPADLKQEIQAERKERRKKKEKGKKDRDVGRKKKRGNEENDKERPAMESKSSTKEIKRNKDKNNHPENESANAEAPKSHREKKQKEGKLPKEDSKAIHSENRQKAHKTTSDNQKRDFVPSLPDPVKSAVRDQLESMRSPRKVPELPKENPPPLPEEKVNLEAAASEPPKETAPPLPVEAVVEDVKPVPEADQTVASKSSREVPDLPEETPPPLPEEKIKLQPEAPEIPEERIERVPELPKESAPPLPAEESKSPRKVPELPKETPPPLPEEKINLEAPAVVPETPPALPEEKELPVAPKETPPPLPEERIEQPSKEPPPLPAENVPEPPNEPAPPLPEERVEEPAKEEPTLPTEKAPEVSKEAPEASIETPPPVPEEKIDEVTPQIIDEKPIEVVKQDLSSATGGKSPRKKAKKPRKAKEPRESVPEEKDEKPSAEKEAKSTSEVEVVADSEAKEVKIEETGDKEEEVQTEEVDKEEEGEEQPEEIKKPDHLARLNDVKTNKLNTLGRAYGPSGRKKPTRRLPISIAIPHPTEPEIAKAAPKPQMTPEQQMMLEMSRLFKRKPIN